MAIVSGRRASLGIQSGAAGQCCPMLAILFPHLRREMHFARFPVAQPRAGVCAVTPPFGACAARCIDERIRVFVVTGAVLWEASRVSLREGRNL